MNPRLTLLALVGIAATLAPAAATRASEKLATETRLECTACHDKPGSRMLTDRGKYFEAMRSMDGYDGVRGSFGRCTTCHVRKPGSSKLTRRGQQMAELAKDMTELKRWVAEGHPVPPKP